MPRAPLPKPADVQQTLQQAVDAASAGPARRGRAALQRYPGRRARQLRRAASARRADEPARPLRRGAQADREGARDQRQVGRRAAEPGQRAVRHEALCRGAGRLRAARWRCGPTTPSCISNRANTLCELNRPREAVAGFDRALKLRPDDPDILNNRGNALLQLNRAAEALACYDRRWRSGRATRRR